MSARDRLDHLRAATCRIAGAPVVRLILKPLIEKGGYHADRFEAVLDGEVVYRGRSPLYGAARTLLERGALPDVLLTARYEGAKYDVFVPRHLGELAKLVVEDPDQGGLKLRAYRPFGGVTGSERAIEGREGSSLTNTPVREIER